MKTIIRALLRKTHEFSRKISLRVMNLRKVAGKFVLWTMSKNRCKHPSVHVFKNSNLPSLLTLLRHLHARIVMQMVAKTRRYHCLYPHIWRSIVSYSWAIMPTVSNYTRTRIESLYWQNLHPVEMFRFIKRRFKSQFCNCHVCNQETKTHGIHEERNEYWKTQGSDEGLTLKTSAF